MPPIPPGVRLPQAEDHCSKVTLCNAVFACSTGFPGRWFSLSPAVDVFMKIACLDEHQICMYFVFCTSCSSNAFVVLVMQFTSRFSVPCEWML
jgi:hypothetical protein